MFEIYLKSKNTTTNRELKYRADFALIFQWTRRLLANPSFSLALFPLYADSILSLLTPEASRQSIRNLS